MKKRSVSIQKKRDTNITQPYAAWRWYVVAAMRDHTSKPSTCGVKRGTCSGAAGGTQSITLKPRHTSTDSSWVPLPPGKQRHTRQEKSSLQSRCAPV